MGTYVGGVPQTGVYIITKFAEKFLADAGDVFECAVNMTSIVTKNACWVIVCMFMMRYEGKMKDYYFYVMERKYWMQYMEEEM